MTDDPMLRLLVGFEERFDEHGHNVVMASVQPDGLATVLSCTRCARTATITTGQHNSWYLVPTRLDLRCPA